MKLTIKTLLGIALTLCLTTSVFASCANRNCIPLTNMSSKVIYTAEYHSSLEPLPAGKGHDYRTSLHTLTIYDSNEKQVCTAKVIWGNGINYHNSNNTAGGCYESTGIAYNNEGCYCK